MADIDPLTTEHQHADYVVGSWTLRAVEMRLVAAKRERDKFLTEIDEHRQQIDWRQLTVETLIDEIAELSALLNDGYPEPQPFTDEQVAAHLENAHIDGSEAT